MSFRGGILSGALAESKDHRRAKRLGFVGEDFSLRYPETCGTAADWKSASQRGENTLKRVVPATNPIHRIFHLAKTPNSFGGVLPP